MAPAPPPTAVSAPGCRRYKTGLGETTPSLKTGGVANDGTPDTRGIGEKAVDAITGDAIDDKTGKVVKHY